MGDSLKQRLTKIERQADLLRQAARASVRPVRAPNPRPFPSDVDLLLRRPTASLDNPSPSPAPLFLQLGLPLPATKTPPSPSDSGWGSQRDRHRCQRCMPLSHEDDGGSGVNGEEGWWAMMMTLERMNERGMEEEAEKEKRWNQQVSGWGWGGTERRGGGRPGRRYNSHKNNSAKLFPTLWLEKKF